MDIPLQNPCFICTIVADKLEQRRQHSEELVSKEEEEMAKEIRDRDERRIEGHIDVLSEGREEDRDAGDINVLAERVKARREEALLLQVRSRLLSHDDDDNDDDGDEYTNI